MSYLEKIDMPYDLKRLEERQLKVLAQEIRSFLIEHVSKTGGHLASNLGVVELTIALLYVFDFTHDKIVFDVGHQSYIYKLLTGRKDQFTTLRQYKGMSGFPKRRESTYDHFETGHSSTSISAAIGFARARDLKKKEYAVIAFIGDGAFTGGMVYEALNDLGFHQSKMLIILNDNQMSISHNVGGLSSYLNKVRISPAYNQLRNRVYRDLDKRHHPYFMKLVRNMKNSFKSVLLPSMFFEDLGLRYIGPIDGHNLPKLIATLEHIKDLDEPVVLHVITKKGKGYSFAEETPSLYHGVGPFDVQKGIQKTVKQTYSNMFGETLLELAKEDKKIVAITAAMGEGTALNLFEKKYPKRFFDVGIAEEHAVTFAAGLAASGLKPTLAIYSTFLQRAYDQVLHDVCMQNLPVVFAIDRGGLVGNDGPTHHGVFDFSFLIPIPNMHIICPKCPADLTTLLPFAFSLNVPVALRYPRGGGESLPPLKKVELGKWEILTEGDDLLILAVGNMVSTALQIVTLLKDVSKKAMVVSATFVKPLDLAFLKKIGKSPIPIVTLEDHVQIGGFGSYVSQMCRSLGIVNEILTLGYSDSFIEQGSIEELRRQEKMDAEAIAKQLVKHFFS